MTLQVALATLLAVLLLYLLAEWLNRTSRDSTIVELPQDPGEAMARELRAVPPHALALKIFDPTDRDFVLSIVNREITETFLAERKRLALAWLRATRKALVRFMRLYRLTARDAKELCLGAELKLALDYLSFLVLCDFLIALIWLRGPYSTTRLVRVTTWLAGRLRAAATQILLPLQAGNQHGVAPS